MGGFEPACEQAIAKKACLEQHTGFEPAHSAWEADMQPLHQCCMFAPTFAGASPEYPFYGTFIGVISQPRI